MMTDEQIDSYVRLLLQDAEEMGGPEEADYIAVMRAIESEVSKRAAHAEHFYAIGKRLAASMRTE